MATLPGRKSRVKKEKPALMAGQRRGRLKPFLKGEKTSVALRDWRLQERKERLQNLGEKHYAGKRSA